MEQAILAMLGIIITLMLYLDRGRRADIGQLRTDNAQLQMETNEGFKEARADNAKLRRDMETGFKESRAENAKLRDDMNDGFKHVHTRLDKLTDVVMDLCRRVGRLEGRAEAWETRPDASQ